MSTKESILSRYKKHIREQFDMPSLDDIKGITYPDPLVQFIKMSESVGGQVIEVAEGRDINTLIKELYPDAKEIASNLPEITIATRNPDTIESAQALNGTDVGIIRGKFGVAENACIWIPQQMKEKAVCFISENLIILLPKSVGDGRSGSSQCHGTATPRLTTSPAGWRGSFLHAQLSVASAVAIDVAIVATHFNTEIKTFLVTFILFSFNS